MKSVFSLAAGDRRDGHRASGLAGRPGGLEPGPLLRWVPNRPVSCRCAFRGFIAADWTAQGDRSCLVGGVRQVPADAVLMLQGAAEIPFRTFGCTTSYSITAAPPSELKGGASLRIEERRDPSAPIDPCDQRRTHLHQDTAHRRLPGDVGSGRHADRRAAGRSSRSISVPAHWHLCLGLRLRRRGGSGTSVSPRAQTIEPGHQRGRLGRWPQHIGLAGAVGGAVSIRQD